MDLDERSYLSPQTLGLTLSPRCDGSSSGNDSIAASVYDLLY